MARIRMSVTGYPSGKIGDLVFKRRNDKIFISMAPVRKNIRTESQKAQSRKFAFCNGLASAVIKNNVFYRRWADADIDAESAYTRIIKTNMRGVNLDQFSGIILIPDDELFPAGISDWQIMNNKLTIRFRSPGIMASGISLQGIIILFIPFENNRKYFRFIPVYTDKFIMQADEELIFDKTLDKAEYGLLNSYKEKRLLINLAARDEQGRVIKFSETKEISIP